MKIVVASGLVAGSHLAHALNTIKMAQGFARLHHDVHLVCLGDETTPETAVLNDHYAITTPIQWHIIPRRILGLPIDPNWLFSLMAFFITLRLRPDAIYCRSYIYPYLTTLAGMPTFAESHAHPGNQTRPFRLFVRASRHKAFRQWITISHRLAAHYQTLGVPPQKITVLPDAVDTTLFQRPSTLPPSPYTTPGPHVTYTGHLYDYKGIPAILETAVQLPHIQFHLVGGLPADIARHQAAAQAKQLTNIHFHGMQPHKNVPPYLWHADLLLLPPSQHHPSAAWTSPLKLGEYLASGTPVIATQIPALQDWLTPDDVVFVPPDDAAALAKAITNLLDDPAKQQALAQNARQKARTLSYTHRAETILSLLTRSNQAE